MCLIRLCWAARAGEHVIVIAEDDDTYTPLPEPAVRAQPDDSCPACASRCLPPIFQIVPHSLILLYFTCSI